MTTASITSRSSVALYAVLMLVACTSEPRSATSAVGVTPATVATPTVAAVKTGPVRVRLPDVTIQKLTNARVRLREHGFAILVKDYHGGFSDLFDPGTVVREWPRGDSAREGRRITLFVVPEPSGSSDGGCTPGHTPCLPLGPADYNCYGGGAGGPYTDPGVTYTVTGSDPYGLDGYDNDGLGCE
jgi:hypothetical protein